MRLLKHQANVQVVKESGFNLLTVVPDLQQLFLQACMTEYYNTEDKPYNEVEGFEDIAHIIIDGRY